MSATLKTSQNALSTTAEEIAVVKDGRDVIEVKNSDSSISIYLGVDSYVSASNGHLLKAGEAFVFERYVGPVWAVAASGTPTVTIIEW